MGLQSPYTHRRVTQGSRDTSVQAVHMCRTKVAIAEDNVGRVVQLPATVLAHDPVWARHDTILGLQ